MWRKEERRKSRRAKRIRRTVGGSGRYNIIFIFMSEFLSGGHHSCEILIISCLSVLRNRMKGEGWTRLKSTLYFTFRDIQGHKFYLCYI
jgi:hypothetical protein